MAIRNDVCLIADSSGGLPQEVVEQHQIIEVPFYFKFQNTGYYCENVDYSTGDFYRHMEKSPEDVPQTAAPNVNDWVAAMEKQYDKGAKKLIVTTISSKLSSSYQTACMAKEVFSEEHKDAKVAVIDSNTCACGQASFEIAIAKMIESGKDFQEIVSRVSEAVTNITTLFVVNNLKYMEAGGRIGGATAFLGKLAQIKPVCEFIEGAVRPVKAVIGRKSSLKTMMDIAASRISDWSQLIITVQNAEYMEDAEYAVEYLKKMTSYSGQIFRSDLGVVVGAHSGPGAAGIGLVQAGSLLR
ncbi:DegV family protein [Clostridium merdae]|uniref:DegV family protein n=1 Tax=Clostridium merdae TaxID=1958780 RepID=UPI000A26C283|nr:DegV family protein [Clostridium merdae]